MRAAAPANLPDVGHLGRHHSVAGEAPSTVRLSRRLRILGCSGQLRQGMQVGSRPRHSRHRFRWCRLLAYPPAARRFRPEAYSADDGGRAARHRCSHGGVRVARSAGSAIVRLRESLLPLAERFGRAEQCSGQPRNATPRPEPGCRALEADGLKTARKRGWPQWGIFTPTPRCKPPAAERRKRPSRPSVWVSSPKPTFAMPLQQGSV